MITSAETLGFAPEARARDRSQMTFLSSLTRRGADRFVLKGGLAMRALYGSARLTKDVDFDCEDSLSDQSLSNQITRSLGHAARDAGLIQPKVERTKGGARAGRWRLTGQSREGVAMTWEVEISRRGIPTAAFVGTATIQPPLDYRIAPFVIRAYTAEAMAASKVNALLSDYRSVPRDVYDLFDLAAHGATPVPLWIEGVPREILERKKPMVLEKIGPIGFELANSELLPYLARDIRASIDEKRWDDMRLTVTEAVHAWFDAAIPDAKTAKELNRDADSELDLAGR